MDAIAQAAFADDLERMSDGLDTLIGEKGSICIGRTEAADFLGTRLLRDAQLLLLDDSLSAVDAKTEQAIIETIQRATRKDNLDSLSPSLSCPSGRLDPCVRSRTDCRRRNS